MYKFKKEQVLDPAFLTRLIQKFKETEVVRYKKDQAYYLVKTKILSRRVADGKPNNRLAHGFCRYITNMATSYFAGKPLRYRAEDPDYQDALKQVLEDNDINSLNFEVSKEASKKGIGFLLLFINESSQLRIKKLDAEDVIPIYSPSLDEFLEAAVRIWSEYDLDGTLLRECADVYDETNVTHFQKESGETQYRQLDGAEGCERHLLSDVPVIVVWNNEEQEGDYEGQISLIDGYDQAQSDTGNDLEYFTDAYLAIRGASEIVTSALNGEDDSEESQRVIRNFRENKLLMLDENGQAQWLVKNVNDAATEHYKDRLYRDIFLLSQVPAMTDESFSGNLSGIAIKYKLIGLEELALMKENRFRAAQGKLLRIVTDYLNTVRAQNWDPATVTQSYERNFIENVADTVEIVKNLDGIVSRQAQLENLPDSVVSDPDKELERIQKEQLQQEGLPYTDQLDEFGVADVTRQPPEDEV